MAKSDFGFQIGSALATQYLTDSKYIRAGYIVVDTIAERNALPIDTGNGGVIVNGSLCYVTGETKFYQYNGSAWIEAEFGSAIDDVKVDGTSVVTDKIANINLTGKQDKLTSANAGDSITITQGGTTHSLPAEYQEVNYLIMPAGAYIDTGIIQQSAPDIETEFRPSVTGDIAWFGNAIAANGCVSFNVTIGTSYIRYGLQTASAITYEPDWNVTSFTSAIYDGNYNILKIANYGVYLNSSLVGTLPTQTTWSSNIRPILINKGHFGVASGNWKSFKIWENNTLEFNGIPCYRKSDNVAGMYDLVSETFKENAGSGIISVGPSVTDGLLISYTNTHNYQTATQVSSAISTHNSESLENVHPALREFIEDEIENRELACGALSDSIDAEEAARITTDTSLQDQINSLKSIGRFLAIWNASTGKPTSYPTVPEGASYPYTYTFKSGDYYRVGTAGTLIPSGISITKQTAESEWTIGTTTHTETVGASSVIYFDGTNWVIQTGGGGGTVQDVQVNGTSILSGHVANILTEGTYSASNKIATMTELASKAEDDEVVHLAGAEDISGTKTFTSTAHIKFIPQTDAELKVVGSANSTSDTLSLYSGNTTGTVAGNTEVQIFYDYATGKKAIRPSTNGTSSAGVELGTENNKFWKLHLSGAITDGTNSITAAQMVAKSTVSAAATGTSTTQAKYITIDNTEYKLGGGDVEDVKINGTSIVTSGVANIPKAAGTSLGVVATNTNYGIGVNANGQIYITAPSDAQVEAKTAGTMAVTLNKLDKAIMEGLGNNSFTWNTTYQTKARTTLDAQQQITYTILGAED